MKSASTYERTIDIIFLIIIAHQNIKEKFQKPNKIIKRLLKKKGGLRLHYFPIIKSLDTLLHLISCSLLVTITVLETAPYPSLCCAYCCV